ncbi:MAG: TetR/AcrR family transcriptional regulator [Advenella sp.]
MSPSSTSSRRRQADRSKTTQQDVILAAIRIISDRGPEAASMQEIAREAGVTPGAIQHHFQSKATLMMHVLATLVDENIDAGKFWPPVDMPIDKRAQTFVSNLWTLFYKQPRFISAWATYLSCRNQPVLLAHISELRKVLQMRLHATFPTIFPELANDPALGAFINLVFSTLRGLGLLEMFAAAHAGTQEQLDCLAELIAQRCYSQNAL